jgi:hypothetical protein
MVKLKLSLCLNNKALRHEDLSGSGCIDPCILDLGTSSREQSASRPGRFTYGTHWIRGWVGPKAGLDDKEKKRILHCWDSSVGIVTGCGLHSLSSIPGKGKIILFFIAS